MNKVHEFLSLAARSYYAGSPIISDEQFDRLADITGYTDLGAKQHENIEKHYFRMYSLQKYYEGEGKPPKLEGEIDVSPKIDGAAVSLLYVEGNLVRALTRGDGVEGTNVTDKFLNTNLVPKVIITDIPILQITGELAAPSHIENARNYAAGSLNLKDIQEFRTRAVTFFAYNAQPSITGHFNLDMRVLTQCGFNTVKDSEIHNIYPCDGIVYRLNVVADFEAAGYTAKHPKGAYALKERKEAVETTLLDVVWQTGKSGKVTPVAILEPIKIGDALVSRATLNNIAYIRALDIRIGDTVGVVRSGEIIPQVVYKAAG
jgi:DNA ligase (NAD+)